MNGIIGFLTIAVLSFILSMVDTFLPFVPPVTPTVAGAIYLTNFAPVITIIDGIIIGIGSTFILYMLRKSQERIKKISGNKKYQNFQNRIKIVIDEIGYYPIILLQATSLGAVVSYIFLVNKDVYWKRYLLYTVIGRTLCLALFVSFYRFIGKDDVLFFAIIIGIYTVMILYSIIVAIKNRDVVVKIIKLEKGAKKK